MNFNGLIVLAGAMFFCLPSISLAAPGSKKRVHIVTGSASSRTHMDMHPTRQKMVLNALVQTCDPKPSMSKFIFDKKSKCLKDKTVQPEGYTGNTLQMVLKYQESGNFNRNCANPKHYRFTFSDVMNPKLIKRNRFGSDAAYDAAMKQAQRLQKQIADCGAQNLGVQGESDTKAILGSNIKKIHQFLNTRSLKNPQACDDLDRFKKVKFDGLAPEKDPKNKNAIYFRNGGFRIGDHTFVEYDGTNKRWCRTTYSPTSKELLSRSLITREQVIVKASKEGKCDLNGDAKNIGKIRPLPIPHIDSDGMVHLRGSMTLTSDGRAFINPINKPTNIRHDDIRKQAYKSLSASVKQEYNKAYRDFKKNPKANKAKWTAARIKMAKVFNPKMSELYKKAMKGISLKDLQNYDKTKGSLRLQFKQDENGLRESLVSTYDKDGNHLRSIQMKPTNVVGSKLDNTNSWCGGENCLLVQTSHDRHSNSKHEQLSTHIRKKLGLGNKARGALIGIDDNATCQAHQAKSLDMAGGENVCMSCFGNTPGQCKTSEITTHDGYAGNGVNPNDPYIGKSDPIEDLVKKRYAEAKSQPQCKREPAQPPAGETDVPLKKEVKLPEVIEV